MNKKRKIVILAILIISLVLFFSLKKYVENKKSKIFTTVSKGPFEISVTSTGELQSEKYTTIEAPAEALKQNEIWEISLAQLIPEGTVVDSGAVVGRLDQTKASEKLMELEKTIGTLNEDLKNVKIDTSIEMSSLRDELLNKKFAIDELQYALDQSKYESPAVVKQAKNQLEKSQREYNQTLRNQQLKRRKTEMLIAQKLFEIQRIEDKKMKILDLVNKLTIKSPSKGMVIYYKTFDGERIETGSSIKIWRDPVIAVLPNFSSMVSNTYINEIEISRIKKGQKVKIGVDAFPNKLYDGIVVSVANIGEQLPNGDAKVFNVLIKLNNSDQVLKPGMTTSNKIIIASFKDALFIPIEAVQQSSKENYVYKPKNFHTAKQKIELGDFNENDVIVKNGLEEGEKIYLSNPNQ